MAQLVARCMALRKSFSATFFPPQLGNVIPKYLTGYPLNSEPRYPESGWMTRSAYNAT